jgi:ElaB/YqjD/DUF883 family membrane-anchored ribosome-binding protein
MRTNARALNARRTAKSHVVAAPDFDRLAEDFRIFVNDCETLLKDAQGLTGEAAVVARNEFAKRVDVAREQLESLTEAASVRAARARVAAEEYIRREPAKALGIAAAAGAIFGILLARRR